MPWRVVCNHATRRDFNDDDTYGNWTMWKNEIESKNLHPSTAAGNLRFTFKKLKGTPQFEVYIGSFDRCTFTIDNTRLIVNVTQIGGHT